MLLQLAGFGRMKKVTAEVDAEKQARGERVKKNHIRQGKAGKWRKTFSEEESRLLDEVHAQKCASLGLPADLFEM